MSSMSLRRRILVCCLSSSSSLLSSYFVLVVVDVCCYTSPRCTSLSISRPPYKKPLSSTWIQAAQSNPQRHLLLVTNARVNFTPTTAKRKGGSLCCSHWRIFGFWIRSTDRQTDGKKNLERHVTKKEHVVIPVRDSKL